MTCLESALPPHQVAWQVENWLGQFWAAALGPDHALWLAAAETSLRLARYDADGSALMPEVELDLAGDNFQAFTEHVSLAVDGRNRGFVALTLSVTERPGWQHRAAHLVLEVDEAGAQVGEPIAIEGVTGELSIAVGESGALLLSATGAEGVAVLGKLGVDRNVDWVQTGLPQTSATTLVSDDADHTLVMGSAAAAEPFHVEDSAALIDERGNLAWETRTDTHFGSALRHADGSVVVIGNPVSTGGTTIRDAVIHKLSADGEPIWARRLRGNFISRGTADEHGNTLFAESGRLVRMNADGECTVRSIESLIPLDPQALLHAPDGTLFFVSFFGSFGVIAP